MKVFGICGSASAQSSNLKLLQVIATKLPANCEYEIFDELQSLPLFNANDALNVLPQRVLTVHEKILTADVVIISTPEYIFSVPAGLKNLLEWCVSTSVFSSKKVALLVASAQGEKTMEDLKLILRTIEAILPDQNCLLIQGLRAKLSVDGQIIHAETANRLEAWLNCFTEVSD